MIDNWRDAFIALSSVAAAILFIRGLKQLSSPPRARRGNQLAALGMAIAVVATLFTRGMDNHLLILIGIAVGAVPSIFFAQTVKMTPMPQMFAIFNGIFRTPFSLGSVSVILCKTCVSLVLLLLFYRGATISPYFFSKRQFPFLNRKRLM